MKLASFDIHTPPYKLFFEQEPDYTVIQQQAEILDHVTNMNNQSICIIDFYKNNYFYISPNHMLLCGYGADYAKNMGEKFIEKVIYEEDKEEQYNLKNAFYMFYASMEVEAKKEITIFSSHRLIHKNGTIFTAFNQYKPYMFDSRKNPWLVLCISTISTKNHRIESYIEITDTNERYTFNSKKKEFILTQNTKLSVKEHEILKLASQGFTSKEIANNKKLSISTIKFHKQNILMKFNVQNISEAILYADSHNMF
jgi:DNA-binding CsgD family transcriptional regulator